MDLLPRCVICVVSLVHVVIVMSTLAAWSCERVRASAVVRVMVVQRPVRKARTELGMHSLVDNDGSREAVHIS